jgi:pilus assembly protein CpaB
MATMPFDFKRSLPFTLAVASGLVTSGMLYNILGHQPKAEASMMEPMVVLAGPVDDTRPLEAKDLNVVQVASRPAGAFANVDEAVGRLPLVPIPGGQPLLTSHLAQRGAAPGLWHQVPKGFRAVTVAVNEVVGVGGFVKPGLNVDIISVYQEQGGGWTSLTIVQDVPVLAIAQDDKKDKEDKSAKIATSATLLVSPPQAEAISLASEKGRIRLVLRAPGDHVIRMVVAPPAHKAEAPKPAPVQKAPPPPPPPPPQVTYFAPRQAAPAPQPPAPKSHPAPAGIEVIRGAKSEVVNP